MLMVENSCGAKAPAEHQVSFTPEPLDDSAKVTVAELNHDVHSASGGGKMQMCGYSNVQNVDVDADKDPHFTHTSDMLHSRYQAMQIIEN